MFAPCTLPKNNNQLMNLNLYCKPNTLNVIVISSSIIQHQHQQMFVDVRSDENCNKWNEIGVASLIKRKYIAITNTHTNIVSGVWLRMFTLQRLWNKHEVAGRWIGLGCFTRHIQRPRRRKKIIFETFLIQIVQNKISVLMETKPKRWT